MNIHFKISAINNHFNHWFHLSEKDLLKFGVIKMVVDQKPGYPCRVSLEDAEVGEEVILLPFQHHKTNSPYQSSGPIFVRKNAKNPKLEINEIPKMLHHRYLSIRAYDKHGIMIAASTIQGEKLKKEIERIFCNRSINYIHIHNAGPGCFNCRVDRVE